jgi:hypothetical protein
VLEYLLIEKRGAAGICWEGGIEVKWEPAGLRFAVGQLKHKHSGL